MAAQVCSDQVFKCSGIGVQVRPENAWGFGKGERLERGSGLFVGKEGITANHHFLLPPGGVSFDFVRENYRLEIWATLVEGKRVKLFSDDTLHVTEEQSTHLKAGNACLTFNWGPDSGKYQPHLRRGDQVELQSPPIPCHQALKVDVVTEETNTVALGARATEVRMVLRILNTAPFAVLPTVINAVAYVELPNVRGASKQYIWSRNALHSGAHEIVVLTFEFDSVTETAPTHALLRLAGEIVAIADVWQGKQNASLGCTSYGRVVDERVLR